MIYCRYVYLYLFVTLGMVGYSQTRSMFNCPGLSNLSIDKYNFNNVVFLNDWVLISDVTADSIRYNIVLYKYGYNQKYIVGYDSYLCYTMERIKSNVKIFTNGIQYDIKLTKKLTIRKVKITLDEKSYKIRCNYDDNEVLSIGFKKSLLFFIGEEKEIKLLVLDIQEHCDKLVVAF